MNPRWLIAAVIIAVGCGRGTPNGAKAHSGMIGALPIAVTLNVTGPAEIELDQFDRDLALVVDGIHYDSRETGPETIIVEAPSLASAEIKPVQPRNGESRWRLRIVRAGSIPRLRERRQAVSELQGAKKAFEEHRSDAAIVALGRAEELARAADDPEAEATAIAYRGAVASMAGNLAEAVELHSRARPVFERTGSKWMLMECENNAGYASWRLGRFRDAERHLSRALELDAELGNQRGEAAALSNLGNVYQEAGDYSKALAFHDKSMKLAVANGDSDFPGLIHNNIALAQQGLGKPVEAKAAFERANALFLKQGNSRAAGRATLRIAEMRFEAGEDPSAELQQARKHATAAKDKGALAMVLTLEGRMALRANRAIEAKRLLTAALDKVGGVPVNRAAILHELGTALGPAGQSYLQAALELRRELGAREGIAATLHRMAGNARRGGQFGQARQWIGQAIAEIEEMRLLVRGPAHRLTYLAARRRYHAFAVDLLSEMGLDAAALEAAEQGRSRVLLDQLGESAAGIESAAAPEKTKERESVAREIRMMTARLQENPSDEIRQRIAGLAEAHSRVEAEIHAASPALSALRPKVLDARAIQAQLGPDTVLIQYFLSEPRGFSWIVDRTGARARALPGQRVIEDAVAQCASRWVTPESSGAEECITKLAAMLIPETRARRIVVAPDGVLHRIPFAALIPETAAEVVTVPSISVLAAMRSRAQVAPKEGMVILADPVFDAADARVANPRDTGNPPAYRRLGYSRREATAIASIVPGARPRFDFDVSREFIASGGLAESRMVHIATHAVTDESQPELSRLILSQYSRAGRPLDGALFLSGIAQLRLQARLVTLSACSAGSGPRVEGEGPIHLARAFLNAGAQAVAVNLWDVDDEAAYQLMRRFYEQMSGSVPKSPSAALLAAQRDLGQEKRWRQPFYWAGWTLAGEWQ